MKNVNSIAKYAPSVRYVEQSLALSIQRGSDCVIQAIEQRLEHKPDWWDLGLWITS